MIRRAALLVVLCLACAGCSGHDASAARKLRVPFDAARAFALLERQVAFGPRVPGTAAHDSCAAYLLEQLRAVGDSVWTQSFTGQIAGTECIMTNLLAAQRPAAPTRVMLLAHWDTRPWADEDPDRAQRRTPVIGANDGASGVAAILEMARVLKAAAPSIGVDIALVDGEDLGSASAPQLYSQGARALVQSPEFRRPALAILFDMVGDAQLTLLREGRSWEAAPRQMRDLWAIGRAQYPAVWLDQTGPSLIDDHVPFIEAGIPAMDIIDFAYPYWHTIQDTPDKCSPASLEAAARPVLTYLYSLK